MKFIVGYTGINLKIASSRYLKELRNEKTEISFKDHVHNADCFGVVFFCMGGSACGL